jgi:hypothetical protein
MDTDPTNKTSLVISRLAQPRKKKYKKEKKKKKKKKKKKRYILC